MSNITKCSNNKQAAAGQIKILWWDRCGPSGQSGDPCAGCLKGCLGKHREESTETKETPEGLPQCFHRGEREITLPLGRFPYCFPNCAYMPFEARSWYAGCS